MNVQQLSKALKIVDRELRRLCPEPRDRARVMGVLSQQYIEEFRSEQRDLPVEDQERETFDETGQEAPV